MSRKVQMNEENQLAENPSGAETASTVSPAVENQTAEDGFLAGFSGETIADEQRLPESDSKGDSAEVENINKEEELEYHRPDRNTRASMRIQQLLRENRELRASQADYEAFEKWKAEQNAPELKLDEDGNASVEDMAEYNRQLITQEIQKQQAENERKIAEVEKTRDLDNSIAQVQAGIAERVQKHAFLNPDSKSYNKKAESLISSLVLDQVGQLQASGVENYTAMSDLVLNTIDQQIAIVESAMEQAKLNAGESLREMQNGGALNSNLNGSPSADDDGFLAGFFS